MKSKENKTTKTKGLGYLYLSNSPNNKKKTIGTKYKTFFSIPKWPTNGRFNATIYGVKILRETINKIKIKYLDLSELNLIPYLYILII